MADLEIATGREWLETNGLGGFASSTIIGLNTRRYHGLLVAAMKPPVGRMVLLSKMEETLVVDGLELEKSLFMVHGENTTVIQYQLRMAARGACTLELRPLIAFRDYHSLTHENGALNSS